MESVIGRLQVNTQYHAHRTTVKRMRAVLVASGLVGRSQASALTRGFSLIEMLVVVAIVGALAAIATPSWLGFMANQRLNRANEQVLQAIRQGQAEAKRTSTYRQVQFDFTADPPRVAIVPVTTAFNPALTMTPLTVAQVRGWETLGQGEIARNTLQGADNNPNSDSIIFSPKGTVVSRALAPANPTQLPYIVTLSYRNRPTMRRCIRVESILGAVNQGADSTLCP